MSAVETKKRTLRKARVETAEKQSYSREEIKAQGLCATCIHAGDCIFLQSAEEPILYCEEFDSGLTPVSAHKPAEKAEAVQPKEDHGLKGLCVNCDNRHTCTFPKPESGVWHCEEYR